MEGVTDYGFPPSAFMDTLSAMQQQQAAPSAAAPAPASGFLSLLTSPIAIAAICGILIIAGLFYVWRQFGKNDTPQRDVDTDNRLHALEESIGALQDGLIQMREHLGVVVANMQRDRKEARELDKRLEPVLKQYHDLMTKYRMTVSYEEEDEDGAAADGDAQAEDGGDAVAEAST